MSELVGVVGGGIMGAGIAEVAARAGCDVIVREIDEATCTASRQRIAKSVDRAASSGKLDADQASEILSRLSFTSDLEALADRDLVIEAVIEDETTKVSIFRALGGIVHDDAILASNTSSIPIMKLAAATSCPERVLGIHFFNPVPVLPLVELVPSLLTSDTTLERAQKFAAERLGKQTIVCTDRAGFVVNALLIPYVLAAIRLVESGFASAEDVDTAMVAGCAHPMGPLHLADLIGLDTTAAVARSMYAEFKEPLYAAPPLLLRMVEAGLLGRKTGRGFFRYPPREPDERSGGGAAVPTSGSTSGSGDGDGQTGWVTASLGDSSGDTSGDISVLDVHNHAMPMPLLRSLAEQGLADLTGLDADVVRLDPRVSGVGPGAPLPLARSQHDVPTRLAEMDAMGVSHHAVSLPPFLFCSTAEDELLVSDVVGRGNDELAAYTAAAPERLLALGSVPLGWPGAADEARRCLDDLGMAGLAIGSSGGRRDLDDPVNEEFWSLVHERDVFVFLHPSGVPDGHRQRDFYLAQLVGYPMETALAVARLLFGGVLETFEPTICLAHGGGCLPSLRGRMDMGWERKDVARTTSVHPSELADRLFYDTAVFSTVLLRRLVEDVGADHVLLGTDHPFELGDRDPVAAVRALGLDEAGTSAVLRDTAAELISRR